MILLCGVITPIVILTPPADNGTVCSKDCPGDWANWSDVNACQGDGARIRSRECNIRNTTECYDFDIVSCIQPSCVDIICACEPVGD